MACNCKHMNQEIQEGLNTIYNFKKLFLKRLTIDSEHNDRRKKDFNQSIFNKDDGWACFNGTDLSMIMDKFDLAYHDYKKSFCDVGNCTRKL